MVVMVHCGRWVAQPQCVKQGALKAIPAVRLEGLLQPDVLHRSQ